MNRKIIYLFGNPILDFDNLPILLKKNLSLIFPEILFIDFDPNENLKPIKMKLSLIDTIVNIKKVTTIIDINKIEISNIYSLHDFDLAYNIKLLEKIGQLNQITIFGLPPDINFNIALRELSDEIKKNYDRI